MAINVQDTEQTLTVDDLPDGFAEPPLKWPDIDERALDRIALDYYEPYDLLSVLLPGRSVPAINVPLDPPDSSRGYAEARVGFADEMVVAIEITGYREEISDLHPQWRNLLTLTGDARRAALRDLIEFVSAMPVYDGPPNDKR